MCGRFVLFSPAESIIKEFHIEEVLPDADLKPSYNIAPTQDIVIVRNDGKITLTRCKWGFIPSWAMDKTIGYKMINARAETVSEKPAFRSSFKSQRCLIVADGFYEWSKEGRVNTPFYIRLKSGGPLGFAGLYNVWTSPAGEHVCTSTIITTDANRLLSPIHERMPVIVRKSDHGLWLDQEIHESKKLLSVLAPYPAEEMELRQVSALVNSPAHNSPDLIKPINNILPRMNTD
ncbi:MAG: SOS response-associated peptidase [Nitrospirae bacterium]|nr:SOS response-associated peptidase [Nitrospirota bacterium]